MAFGSRKVFCQNFANKLDNSESIWGPHHKKHQIRKKFNDRKIDTPRGDPWASEVEKKFLENFLKQTIYSESIWGPHHKKHQIRKNFNDRKIDTPRGDPCTPKLLISQLSCFEPNYPCFSYIF